MARFVIERQYLVPVFEHILVEASTFEEACWGAVDDIGHPWSAAATVDYENARATTITRAVEVPARVLAELPPGAAEDDRLLAGLLYDSDFEPLPLPGEFVEDEKPAADKVGFL